MCMLYLMLYLEFVIWDPSLSRPSSEPTTTPTTSTSTPTTSTPTATPTTSLPSAAPTAATVEIDVIWTAAAGNGTNLTVVNASDSACDAVQTADGEVVAEAYVAAVVGVGVDAVSNLTCDSERVNASAAAARRLDEAAATCVTNYTAVLTTYRVTVVVLAEELVEYSGDGAGSVYQYAHVIEQTRHQKDHLHEQVAQ